MKKVLTIAFAAIFVFGAVSAYACGNDNGSSAKAESSAKVKQIQASVKSEVRAQTARAENLPACCAAAVKSATTSIEKAAGVANTSAATAEVKEAASGKMAHQRKTDNKVTE